MLPIGSRLAIDIIQEFYGRFPGIRRLYLATNRATLPHTRWRPFSAYTILDVGETKSICDTVAAALPRITEEFLVVNPVTSIPSSCPAEEPRICLGREAMYQERWSSVAFDAARSPCFRFRDSTTDPIQGFPFTGVFSAHRKALLPSLSRVPEHGRSDLLYLARELHATGECDFEFVRWIDAGHRTTYALSKRYCIPSRSFNDVTYCDETDLIVKRSTDRGKLESEGLYLRALPAPLRRYFPALHSSRPDSEDSWILEQEYIPFPTLAELFLHWNIGPNAWSTVIRRIRSVLEDFRRYCEPVVGDCGWLYSRKSLERHDVLTREVSEGRLRDTRFRLDRGVVINGRSYPSLTTSVRFAVDRLKPLEQEARCQLIHGDLCFNNILCDPLFGVIKLIDPRGTDAPESSSPCIGDVRYDLAKLDHSLFGLYDSVANNLFELRHSGNELELSVYAPPNRDFLLRLFREQILHPNLDPSTAILLTASLFLSMLPLHAEDPDRLLALMAIGLLILHDRSMDSVLEPLA